MGNNLDDPSLDDVYKVEYGDSPSLDAFGRLRVGEPFGIFDNKNGMSKNPNQWEERISGVIVVHGAVAGGPFVVGETIIGSTTNTKGVIDVVGAGSLTITVEHGNNFDILTPENIVGQTSGASASVTTINTGSDITHLILEAAVELKCGQLATDYAIRQTTRYHAYLPGKSQNISETFVLGAGKNNVIQRVGLFDDNDGLFLEQDDADLYFVLRSSTSGAPVDTKIHRDNPIKSTDGISVWNKDKLNGNGSSKVVIDLTKSQIFQFDFQWLGSGRVRFGFNFGGMKVEALEVNHANALDKVYMATPTLPLRYELRNSGVPASDTTMKEICCSITSEGGYSLPGFEFNQGVPWAAVGLRSVGTARTPIFAIRLRNTFNGIANRRIGRFLHANFFATGANTLFEIAHLHNPDTAFGIGGTPTLATWTNVGGGSGVEYSTDITAVVGNPEHVVGDTPVATGQAGKGGGDEEDAMFINLHSFFSQNANSDNSQMYVIYAIAANGSADVWASMKWVEFD